MDEDSLYMRWMMAKKAELDIVAKRRAIEDELVKELGVDETKEGSQMHHTNHYSIKVTTRANRKVNGTLLQEVAQENGLTDYLSTLFRWSPTINMKEWKETDKEITNLLLEAVTTKPGRPSFVITIDEEK